MATLISSITGKITELGVNFVTIDINGVGMSAAITARHASKLQLGASTTLFTNLTVREDSLTLYGFENQNQREFFELLQTVSGIGPKVALSIIAAAEVVDISRAIVNEDLKRLQEIPGLGKKSAQRLVLDLKDKIKIKSGKINDWASQVAQALESLGYSAKESSKIAEQVASEMKSQSSENVIVSEALKLALQIAGRSKRA